MARKLFSGRSYTCKQEKREMIRNNIEMRDCWSWRKYGQKPIKRSPHPRVQNRCIDSHHHNHPDPAPFSLPTTPNQDSETNPDEIEVPPLNSTSGHAVGGGGEPFEEILQTLGVRYGDAHGCDVLKSDDNGFYDELEELPTSSSFTAFMKSGFYEGTVAVNLSS